MDIGSRISGIFGNRTIAETRREGSVIKVIEKGRPPNQIRMLMYNGITFSTIKNGSIYTNSYWDYFLPLPSIFREPKILILGLGGGTIPYQIESMYPNASIDAVEVDRDIIEISKKFLQRELRARIIAADGYEYLNKIDNTYSIIISDPYIDDSMPEKFLSRKFVSCARSKLVNGGIFAVNFAISHKLSQMLEPFISEIEAEFGSCSRVIPLTVPGNNIIIASKGTETRAALRSAKRLEGCTEAENVSTAYAQAVL